MSQWLKLKVKNALSYTDVYERMIAAEAARHQVDGVVCGHIHHTAVHDDFGIRYVNCGDRVESCTAMAEHFDGRMQIIHWTREAAAPPLEPMEARMEPHAAA